MGERKGTKGLELWCRKMTEGYAGVKIDNMTTSWRDGLAFCAIIHHFRPDLIDFNQLNKEDIYHNNELAFRIAEHHLGIPALLEPEDMVEYEVPDRLSILTYLSQFYQTFESQRGKSGARIAPKRSQSTPDHGIVSPASTSPPTKVQITIGRAKREPCAKCGLPVFIAERLNVGKLLYHRTCFRCARCKSQLTLANYYETENNEFCCEICPDEEKIISKKLSSEHSVLLRSMSDEQKSASLQTYSDAPDAFSAHFESALEYPVDDDLKKSSTLNEGSTEFTKARSHFFKSQIEDSSDSGSENIPPDLPESKPPPLTNKELVFSDSSFPSEKKDNKLVSNSVSELSNEHHFVTKDSASSTGGGVVSVRARMKLFEDNKTNKSDVNRFSLSNPVPLGSAQKKKATVIAIGDLEDFDNISRKDISSSEKHKDEVTDASTAKQEEKTDNKLKESNVRRKDIDVDDILVMKTSSTEKHKDEVTDVQEETTDIELKESNLELSPYNRYSSSINFTLSSNNLDQNDKSKTHINHPNISTEHTSHILIDSDKEDANITESKIQETHHISIQDSLPTTNISDNIVSISDSSTSSSTVPKRGYYTAYEVSSPVENDNVNSSYITISSDKEDANIPNISDNIVSISDSSSSSAVPKRGYYTAYEILSPVETDHINSGHITISSDEGNEPNTTESQKQETTHISITDSSVSPNGNSSDIVVPISDVSFVPADSTNLVQANNSSVSTVPISDLLLENEDFASPFSPARKTVSNEVESATCLENELLDRDEIKQIQTVEHEEIIENRLSLTQDTSESVSEEIQESPAEKTDTIATVKQSETLKETILIGEADTLPLNKTSQPDESEYPTDLNPFGEFDDTDEKNDSVASISLNPFGEFDDDDDEIIEPKPIPAARPKKKLILSSEEKNIIGTPGSRITIQGIIRDPFKDDEDDEVEVRGAKPTPSPRVKKKISCPRISLNPFGSDEDEDDDRIVPVPTPRTTKSFSNRPDPKPRDNLSITSRGSHGGSNSSISSGSAMGSARKKKPAPRPPLPFKNNEQSTSGRPSAAPSPNLSGTLKSRKTKRAPPPPPSSTPNPTHKNEESDSFSATDLSFISMDNSQESPIKPTDDDKIHSEKNFKDEENRNRQSQHTVESTPPNENDTNNLPMLNKSTSGRWKRRKGQAPSRPIPQKRITKCLPISEIKRELETIEIQQQGLEKQGVRLEQIIREKCEGEEGGNQEDQVPIEVEDLILQLFELVNEKNELFRRQAELMYLRRQQRLEEEHADVEYQIRCLMMQPEANKTDSDKAREEALINRLVEIVERKNEIIECLEMDRVREAEEDNSISSQLNLYSLKIEGKKDQPKEEKKDKKKKHKKLTKIIHTLHKHKEKEKDHKVDVDKDVDETEVNLSSEKKKKKKFNLF